MYWGQGLQNQNNRRVANENDGRDNFLKINKRTPSFIRERPE